MAATSSMRLSARSTRSIRTTGAEHGRRGKMTRAIRVGSRTSPMAMAQTREVVARLEALPGAGAFAFEIVGISTTGDEVLDRPLTDIGGKGLFVKALERELLSGSIDLAVHSMKDVES